MLKAIRFRNFKALRDCELPLGRCTIIVGPNGSGKSTVLQAIEACRSFPPDLSRFRTILSGSPTPNVSLVLKWVANPATEVSFDRNGTNCFYGDISPGTRAQWEQEVLEFAGRIRVFAFNANSARDPVMLSPNIQLERDGWGLAGVLDRLRDQHEVRWESLNRELATWLPEFERVTFETPDQGRRAVGLRRAADQSILPASMLSDGTMLSLCFLALAHLPQPPTLIGIEEPEHGLHPWLMRRVQDALYRLCYPEQHGEKRDPVQIIATTHSPYFLDLFKDHPEEVVVASKDDQGVQFKRVADFKEITAILQDAPLGELWNSGAIGGVPVHL